MQNRTLKILSILLFIFSISHVILHAKERKQLRINWEEIEGVKKYRVEIKDNKGKIMIDEETEVNYLDFILPTGKYKIRIGSLNKFDKINTWSDWGELEIKVATKGEKNRGPRYKPKVYDLELIKLGIGYSYFYLLPEWDTNYESSYINAHLNLGLYLGAFNKLKKIKFFRLTGMELEFHYIQFTGIEVNNVISNLQNIIFGFNLYIRSDFKFPINVIFRFGGGLSYTIQKYKKYTATGSIALQGDLKSIDFYYKPELAVEFRAAKIFYIELGMGFISILYKDETMYSLKPFVMFGFTF